MNILSLRERIERFCEEYFVLDELNIVDTKWAIQHSITSQNGTKGIAYYPPKCGICPPKDSIRCHEHKRQLTYDHLYDHFSQQAFRAGQELRGTLAFVPNFGGQTKTLIIDFDSKATTDVMYTKIVPYLEQQGIDYFIETPPEDHPQHYDKAHLTIKVELMDIKLLKVFVIVLMEQCDIDRKVTKLEVFPTDGNSLFRLIGGRHLRRDCTYLVNHKGVIGTSPEEILDLAIGAGKLDKEFIKTYIKQYAKTASEEKKRRRRDYRTTFSYVPLNLPLDKKVKAGMPARMLTLSTECQAINSLMNLVYEANLLNQDGVHDEGKFIGNLAMENDITLGGEAGETWFYNALNETRDRTDEHHRWFKKDEYLDSPAKLIPRCETWHEYFGLCDGCVWKNYKHITNPKQLLYGKRINKTKIRDIKLTTVAEIRATTLKDVCNKATEYVINKQFGKDLVIASPPSSGKTYATDKLAVDLAAQGYNILIATPSGKLAEQHKAQIKQMGGEAFAVKSYDGWFPENGVNSSNPNVRCKDYTEISRTIKLGVGASAIRKNYCKTCPFLESCTYPGQYAKAALPGNNIVIIQHAHFACRETMFTLFGEKQFDLLIVDEEFISNINKEIKVTTLEKAVFDEQHDNIEWLGDLSLWFEGNPTKGTIQASETDLEILQVALESRNCPWSVPEYITHYNAGRTYDKRLGLFVFYPVPDIPVRIFTDATPPLEMLEIVLDNTNIEVFGKEEVLNLQASNKDNKIIQVLDSSTSKSALAQNDYELFFEILEFIGDNITNSFPTSHEEILLTLYKDDDVHNFTTMAEEWLMQNYPKIFEQHKIIFGIMSLGTNDYQNCAKQYQVAGLHYNTLQLHMAAYKLKCIANHWNRVKGRPPIVNMYPWNVTPGSSLETIPMPLYRSEIDPTEGPGLFEYEFDPERPYDGLYQSVPFDKYLKIVIGLTAAKKQQAMRIIRNETDIVQEVFIFDKEERPTQATNHSVPIHYLLGYLRE